MFGFVCQPQGQPPVYQQEQPVCQQQQQYGYAQGQVPNQRVIQATPNSRVRYKNQAKIAIFVVWSLLQMHVFIFHCN